MAQTEPDKEKRYAFDFPELRLTLGADAKRHGIVSMRIGGEEAERELIMEPFFALNVYRLMGAGGLIGYARSEPFRASAAADGLHLDWQPTERHPCKMDGLYRIVDQRTVDFTLSVEALQPLERYEVSVSSYFHFMLEPYAMLAAWPGQTEDAEMRLVKMEDHPYIKGHYVCLPRDWKYARTRTDGRWFDRTRDKLIAHHVIGPAYGRPVAVMAGPGVWILQMTEPAACSAIDITYASDDDTDNIKQHNAMYFNLFGEDLSPGDRRQATVRQVLCEGEADPALILKLYRDFMAEKDGTTAI